MIATLAVIGIIYGALVALAQTDIKRLVAYSSVSHMGFIVLGMFALNATGMDGAVIQMINHGLTTGALFACVGVIYERYHTREMAEIGGLWDRLPLLAFFLILSSLGSAAVPGLNGFVGEFPILAGMFQTNPKSAVLARHRHDPGRVLPALDAPACHLRAAPRAARARARPRGRPPGRLARDRRAGPLMALIVVIGVYPGPIFERLRPAVRIIAARFAAPSEAGPVPTVAGGTPSRTGSNLAP